MTPKHGREKRPNRGEVEILNIYQQILKMVISQSRILMGHTYPLNLSSKELPLVFQNDLRDKNLEMATFYQITTEKGWIENARIIWSLLRKKKESKNKNTPQLIIISCY